MIEIKRITKKILMAEIEDAVIRVREECPDDSKAQSIAVGGVIAINAVMTLIDISERLEGIETTLDEIACSLDFSPNRDNYSVKQESHPPEASPKRERQNL